MEASAPTIGDYAYVQGYPFVIRDLLPYVERTNYAPGITGMGYLISPPYEPNRLSLVYRTGGQWQVYNYNLPHTVIITSA